MHVLIYAAGYGKRLGKLTEDTSKVMLPIGGKPCLEWIVEKFESAGANQIIVNTHWKALDIMSYFEDRVLYTFEPVLLGEGQTLARLEHWLKDEFAFVCNGDTLSDIDLELMLEFAAKYNCNVRHVDKGVYAGYMLLHPDYFNGNKKFIDLTTEAEWIDIGSPQGLAKAQKKYGKIKK